MYFNNAVYIKLNDEPIKINYRVQDDGMWDMSSGCIAIDNKVYYMLDFCGVYYDDLPEAEFCHQDYKTLFLVPLGHCKDDEFEYVDAYERVEVIEKRASSRVLSEL